MTAPDALRAIDAAFDGGAPVLVEFLNSNVSNLAEENRGLSEALNAGIVLNDGIGVDLASKLLYGRFFPENLNGTDFVPWFLAHTTHRFRIYLIGAGTGVAARAAESLRRVAPRHTYLGARDGFFSADEQAAVAAAVRATGADLVLVGMGTPNQEIWAHTHLMTPDGPSVFCVGGLFDFVAKNKPRAYQWVRQIRCEWLFRLVVEPRRLWWRYLVGTMVFIVRLFRARFSS
ncbi:putative N-acetyl-mannosamine transferase [Rhodovulum sp. PH10]|uniref:WecB/TagA/CpsF family glycosyltransferase n=1 Tax=Rhodovulum sp. PH10 TaxID=1187851 RepID=UPI00027C20A2|nr:WecB/TagA/CpsF family glycosyltransferase [Rhodovulum sp. PH10]EJW10331.1 putative N-acetyl-mannosamine transferase [Rhodovulum sp. PH10]